MDEQAQGWRSPPDEVWAAVREDYLAGRSAPDCCRRHGVGLTSLRNRAAREGWRRQDQPWTPPNTLDPWDEGVELELQVGGDLDKVETCQLWYVAHRRMLRAVMRGDATEALRWRRVEQIMNEVEAETDRLAEAQDAAIWHARNRAEIDALDGLNGLDGVSESAEPSPPRPDQDERDDGGVATVPVPSPLAGGGGIACDPTTGGRAAGEVG